MWLALVTCFIIATNGEDEGEGVPGSFEVFKQNCMQLSLISLSSPTVISSDSPIHARKSLRMCYCSHERGTCLAESFSKQTRFFPWLQRGRDQPHLLEANDQPRCVRINLLQSCGAGTRTEFWDHAAPRCSSIPFRYKLQARPWVLQLAFELLSSADTRAL